MDSAGRVAGATAGTPPGSTLAARVASVGALTPRRITAVYLVLGFSALLFSDLLLARLVSEPLLGYVQAAKGAVEVVLTGGLIYLLTAASDASHRRTTAELERHREELRVLHRLLRHNLRNDLNVVLGQAQRLRERVDGDAERACESVIEAAENVVDYAERARTIRKLTERERRTVDLADLVPAIVAAGDGLPAEAEVRTELPDAAPVRVNELFETALGELLANAATHGGPEPEVVVTVDPDAGPPGEILVEVRDDGPGLPAYAEAVLAGEERDQLVHLDGLGLWLAYLTVIESGGEFSIPADADGTTIRMTLPSAEPAPDGPLSRWL